MKKLFISQPMNGKSGSQIMLERQAAIDASMKALGEDVEVLDTYFPKKMQPLGYLGKAIMVLAEADVAYFAPGWRGARGCRIENACAHEYGIPVIET